jgi:predicted nucleic acid-binding protein
MSTRSPIADNVVVLDSSFLVAYHSIRDTHHESAKRAMQRLVAGEWGRGLLLEYVFLEVTTVLLVRGGLAVAIQAASDLLEAAETDFLPCSDLFTEALDVFRTRSATTLSFTDAAIVAAARARGDSRVATFDADFRQVPGLVVVPD